MIDNLWIELTVCARYNVGLTSWETTKLISFFFSFEWIQFDTQVRLESNRLYLYMCVCVCTSKREKKRNEYWYGWSDTSHYTNRSWNCSNNTLVSHTTSRKKRTRVFICLDMYCVCIYRLVSNRNTKWRENEE
jgi:hypothetical protein